MCETWVGKYFAQMVSGPLPRLISFVEDIISVLGTAILEWNEVT